MAHKLILPILFLAIGAMHSTASAQCCPHCGTPCKPAYVTKTVMVPRFSYETRTVKSTAYRYETRERAVTAYKCVAETAARTHDVTVMVPQVRSKTVNYTVQKPVWRTVQQSYAVAVPSWKNVTQSFTVQVPYQETREATRIECRTVPVTQTKTVSRDVGHWQNQVYEVPYHDPCGTCCVRTVCKPVWVSKIVTEEVTCTAYKTEHVQVPYTYNVTLCRPETRSRTVRVCQYHTETRTRDVQVCDYEAQVVSRDVRYTVMIPTTQTQTYHETNYRMVPYETVQSYQVCVPYTIDKPIQVAVCHMIPKTVQVPVAPPCDCCY